MNIKRIIGTLGLLGAIAAAWWLRGYYDYHPEFRDEVKDFTGIWFLVICILSLALIVWGLLRDSRLSTIGGYVGVFLIPMYTATRLNDADWIGMLWVFIGIAAFVVLWLITILFPTREAPTGTRRLLPWGRRAS